ncbi:PREDICTED: LOC110268692 [Prunus dulcis]|uniref:PREDICTED: LOC110268692 n=1 Tax=Prunus dulcis TaxID=3755 RepID=A0A5E4EUR2_PRUDU|nr:uncharacterized protein LOC117619390 [Prunus dulcis]KAI5345481.1 hypothetical protein L3X38_013358 [Prunus dulcis]VVA19444.1 PREDICTED: LOC110268692 [Prunus dulcis]
MGDKPSDTPIPDGWKFKSEVRKDGSTSSCYWCPATGQHFFTYEDLMRYVNYAKEAKLSIYAPDFNSNKTRKKAGFIPRRTRPSSGARRKLLGQSSRPLPLDQGEDSGSLEGSTDPVESTDTGKNIEAGLHEALEDPIRQEAFNE